MEAGERRSRLRSMTTKTCRPHRRGDVRRQECVGREGEPVPVAADSLTRRASSCQAQRRAGSPRRRRGNVRRDGSAATAGRARRRVPASPAAAAPEVQQGLERRRPRDARQDTLNIAERDVLRCAADEAKHPKVPSGHLMSSATTTDGRGHRLASSTARPSTWMSRFARHDVRRAINLEPSQGFTAPDSARAPAARRRCCRPFQVGGAARRHLLDLRETGNPPRRGMSICVASRQCQRAFGLLPLSPC